MKKHCLLLGFVITLGINIEAQERIEVLDISKQISRGLQPGFTVSIKGATLEKVTKKWTQQMKPQKIGDIFKTSDEKVKFELKEGEYLTTRANIPEISNKPMNTIATITSIEGGVMINGFFELDSVFISPKSAGNIYQATRGYMRNFGVACYREVVSDEFDREDKKLKQLTNQLDDLKSKKTRFEKDISRSETEISEQEAAIRVNLVEQDRSNIKVAALKDTLAGLSKTSLNYEVYNNKLKEATKENKRLVNDNSSSYKKIENNKRSIKDNEDAIRANIIEQDYQMKQIEIQKGIVNTVKAKLDGIK